MNADNVSRRFHTAIDGRTEGALSQRELRCPACGIGALCQATRDVVYRYKGHTMIIPRVSGDFCTACDEYLTGPEESRRSMELMLAFNRQVG